VKIPKVYQKFVKRLVSDVDFLFLLVLLSPNLRGRSVDRQQTLAYMVARICNIGSEIWGPTTKNLAARKVKNLGQFQIIRNLIVNISRSISLFRLLLYYSFQFILFVFICFYYVFLHCHSH